MVDFTKMREMELLDRQLLNLLQSRFPVVDKPFEAIGQELGLEEAEVLGRIKNLKKKRILRQISAIFDTRKLGYHSSLIAMRLAPHRLDQGARIINQHPGVSHNYAREGSSFNLWFTLAVPGDQSLEAVAEDLARRAGAESYRIMPTVRFFKIGVNLDVVNQKGAAYPYYSPDGYHSHDPEAWRKPVSLSPLEIRAVQELQEDLPLESRPFQGMADRLGISLNELFQLVQSFRERGILRRYAAILYHRKAGFKANAMVVWRVPAERSEEVGRLMAASPWVSHCYERPTFPDWPYTHFTMIHAPSRRECERVAREISEQTGIRDYKLLYSTREYKKTRVKYFV